MMQTFQSLGRSLRIATSGYKSSFALHTKRWNATLVLAECPTSKVLVSHATLSAVEAAQKFDFPVDVFVSGKGSDVAAKELSKIKSIKSIYYANDAKFDHSPADICSNAIAKLIKDHNYSAVVGPHCTYVKNILPRCAASFDVQPISDVVSIESSDTFLRPTYAGNAIAKVKTSDKLKLITVRSIAFNPNLEQKEEDEGSVHRIEESSESSIQWIADELNISEKPQLSNSKVVVSGGRALKSSEGFEKILGPLCDKMKAALGASRAAVDAGYVPNDLQVGQTGKIVAPDLYLAVGISGAIQHMAGMKDSKTIVAINKDGDAPIFQVADYGMVGDLFEIIPELTSKVKQA